MSTENFYFEDFTGDYYLSKDEKGVSHLKVSQKMTAVFPNYNQNKGICLDLPRTNQAGKNITLPNLNKNNIKVLRNGRTEPIYSLDNYGNYYEVCTGDESYVLGTQKYTFEYAYEKVITSFSTHDELYWDTNGDDWWQKFNSVTARVHLADDISEYFTGEAWCYVGVRGDNNQERCKITKTDDGMEFHAESLDRHENLTFDMEFTPGGFTVPEPAVNYCLPIMLLMLFGVCAACIGLAINKFAKTGEKRNYYKGLFVKPEYQPNRNYTLSEAAEVYIGKKKDAKVGMLLDLIIRKKVKIIKKGKNKWGVGVLSLDGVNDEERDLLEILNGGYPVVEGAEIEVKNREATLRLVSLRKKLESDVVNRMREDGLVESKYSFAGNHGLGAFATVVLSIMAFIFLLMVISVAEETVKKLTMSFGLIYALEDSFMNFAFVFLLITVVVCAVLIRASYKYEKHTIKGLTLSRYMDGLKMYISMAEAERIKFLQSVEGAEVSPEGIVKLYEKLLPYAAVFGLEDSWMKELERYCEVQDLPEPDFVMTGITMHEIMRATERSVAVANSSTTYSSDSSGGSSGFSGGGGGGFSGGGGGGGGGHGR